MNLHSTKQAALDNGDVLQLPAEVKYCYITDRELSAKAYDYLKTYVSNPNNFLAVDIETNGFDVHLNDIYLLQMGTAEGIQYIFDVRKDVDIEVIRQLLHKTPCWKLGHNIKFDAKFLKVKYGINLTKLFDTYISEKVIRGGEERRGLYSLTDVVYTHLNLQMKIESHDFRSSDDSERVESAKKTMQSSFINHPIDKEFSKAQLAYAASDVAVIFPVAERQISRLNQPFANMLYDYDLEKIQDQKQRNFYKALYPPTLTLWETAQLEFAFLEVVIDLELTGVGFNVELHKQVMSNVKKEYDLHRKSFLSNMSKNSPQRTLLGTAAINPDSPKMVLEALKHTLGLEPEGKKTDVQALTNLLRDLEISFEDNPSDITSRNIKVVSTLLKYRKMSKLISSFGDALVNKIHPVTNRIHSDINSIVRTGRMSVNNPNFQQIPANIEWHLDPEGKTEEQLITEKAEIEKRDGIRECFIPRDGYCFVVADYSQQELRAAASISNEYFMLNAYKEEKDLHSAMAAEISGYSYADFMELLNKGDKEAKKIRSIAKTVNFGLIYGLSAFNLSKRMGMSIEEAQKLFNKIWKTYANLKIKLDKIHKFSNKHFYSNTVLGRQRFYLDLKDKISWVNSANNPMQVERLAREFDMGYLCEGFNRFTGKKNEITYDNMDAIKSKIIGKIQGEISRQSGNHAVQGSSSDTGKLAAVRANTEFIRQGLDAKIVLLVHDELVVEVIKGSEEKVKEIVENEMNFSMNYFFPLVPSISDAKVCQVWEK